VFVIPVERESANAFFFDGLDSGSDTENVTISGKFITDATNHKVDTYYILNRNNNTTISADSYNRTPPVMCLVTDTFWLFTSKNGGTVEYNTKETWNELFQKRYPDLYGRLMSAYMARYA
jgi:hypothetical protein